MAEPVAKVPPRWIAAFVLAVAAAFAGWCLVQTVLNAPFAALSAAIPDQVPVAQRGAAGGYFGIAQIAGVMIGTGLAVAGIGLFGATFGGYLVCALFVLVAWIPYAALRRDIVLTPAERGPLRWGAFLRGFWLSPRRYPDFAWAWLTGS